MRSSSLLAAVVVAVATTLAAAPVAHAQIADALGRPLPSNDLPTGTIVVKVIAGMVTKPVIGTEVTLVVNGTPRAARTDSEGHAAFPDLPPGATVQAKVLDDDKKEVTSSEFQVPEDSGARVMITTAPFQPLGGGGGAPFAGGMGGGMPDPRQVSGQPRPEQKNAPGELTVLVCYGDLKDVVENIPVTLVGYAWDGKLTVKVAQTAKDGRARFADLDRTGGTAYYALAELPRNGAADRLMSGATMFDSQVGMAMLLSGDKRASTAPPIDELARFEAQGGVAAGEIRVNLRGLPVGSQQVELVDAQTTEVVGHVAPRRGASDVGDVVPSAEFDPTDGPAGTFDITMHGGPKGQGDKPLGDIEVRVAPAGQPNAEPTVQRTDATGKSHFALAPGSYTVTVVLNDKPMTSQPFDLSKQGLDLNIGAVWDLIPHLEAVFQLDAHSPRTLYARTLGKGGETDIYRSMPFHVVPDRGVTASILVAPHVVFSFRMLSEVDDTQLAVRGLFDLENLTWAPYKDSPDGLVVPLPRHFKGAIVGDNEQQIASVDAAVGFRLPHPLSPMRTQFHGGFSLPVDGGDVNWELDLPFGAFQSGLRIVPFTGMKVELPGGVQGKDITMDDGTKLYDISPIAIERGKSMVMTIHGLPSAAAWKLWVPRVFGVVVVTLMLGGLAFALVGRRRGAAAVVADPARDTKRAKLMDELVEIDRAGATSGKDRKRRDAVIAELEKLWD